MHVISLTGQLLWRQKMSCSALGGRQASQGSGREELEGGGEEQEGEIEMLDKNSDVEKTITDSDIVRSSSEHLSGEKKIGRRRGSVDYLLEKLRRRLCCAGDIITPLQQPSMWTIMLPIFY